MRSEYHYFNGGPVRKRPWSRKRKVLAWSIAAAAVLAQGLWGFLSHWVPGDRLAGYFSLEEIHSARVEVQDVATREVLASKDLTKEETARFRACLEDTALWRQGAGTFPVYEDATWVVWCFGSGGETLGRWEFWGGRRLSVSASYPDKEGQWNTVLLWGRVVSTQADEYLSALLE